MGAILNAIDEAVEYVDNELFDKHITRIQDASANLKLNDDVFEKEDSAVGTDALTEFSKQLQEVFIISNSYKTHMHSGIIPLLLGAKKYINDAAEESGKNAMTFMKGLGFDKPSFINGQLQKAGKTLSSLEYNLASVFSGMKDVGVQLDARGQKAFQNVTSLLKTNFSKYLSKGMSATGVVASLFDRCTHYDGALDSVQTLPVMLRDTHYNRNSLNGQVDDYRDVISDIKYGANGKPIISTQDGWVQLPDSMAVYHRMTIGEQGAEAMYNYKFLYDTGIGSQEVIVCVPDRGRGEPYIVTDPYNAGTYNYVNPGEKALSEEWKELVNNPSLSEAGDVGAWLAKGGGHFVCDVLPYWLYGNAEEDSGLDVLAYRLAGPENVEKAIQTVDSTVQWASDKANDCLNTIDQGVTTATNAASDAWDSFKEGAEELGSWIESW